MKKLLPILFICACGTMPALAQQGGDIIGVWLTEGGKSRIEVTQRNGKYYGTIIWLRDPYESDGKTVKVDDENPKKELRTRPIVGIEIIKGLEFDEDEWDNGDIYDPESGNTYSAIARMPDKNTLKVRGYLGFSLLGRTTVWTRVRTVKNDPDP